MRKLQTKSGKKSATRKATLTKRVVVRAGGNAVRKASARAMELEGFIVKADNGWVVRHYADGRIERLKRISTVKPTSKIVLD